MKDSLNLAIEYVSHGITTVTELKEDQLREFSIQLFSEEDDYGDQVSMLVDSDYFKSIPKLLISLIVPQDPYPSGNLKSDMINSMIQDNVKGKISNTLIKCLVSTYSLEMQRLLDYAVNDMSEINEQCHNDYLYTQSQEAQL